MALPAALSRLKKKLTNQGNHTQEVVKNTKTVDALMEENIPASRKQTHVESSDYQPKIKEEKIEQEKIKKENDFVNNKIVDKKVEDTSIYNEINVKPYIADDDTIDDINKKVNQQIQSSGPKSKSLVLKEQMQEDLLKEQRKKNNQRIRECKSDYIETYSKPFGFDFSKKQVVHPTILDYSPNYNNLNIKKVNEALRVIFRDKKVRPNVSQLEVLQDCLFRDTCLIMSSAGSGKTTFVPMWVYAQKTINNIPETNIACISMTNVARNEINKKIRDYGLNVVSCRTIHGYFADFYEKCFGIRPKFVDPSNFLPFIEKELKGDYSPKYFRSYIKSVASEEDETIISWQEREKLISQGDIISFKGEKLKSYGELYIANWLAIHGIDYIYEKPYPYSDFAYKPDFYIPSKDLWIEFFGIDKSGNVAPGFSSRKSGDISTIYRLEMKQKKQVHKDNNTKLLSLYLWEKNDGLLEKKLEKTFSDIMSKEVKPLDIWLNNNQKNITVQYIAKYFESTALFMEARGLTPQQVKEDAEYKNPNLLGERVAIARTSYDLLQRYEKEVNDNHMITFSQLANIIYDYLVANKDKIIKSKLLPQYLFIDECQDIPFIFLKVIKKLNEYGTKIFLAGDPRQSIYGFAGCSTYEELKESFPNLFIYTFPNTTRLTKSVEKMSSEFIEKDKYIPKMYGKSLSNNLGYICIIGDYYPQETAHLVNLYVQKEFEKNPNAQILFQGRDNNTVEWLVKFCDVKVTHLIGENKKRLIFKNGYTAYYATFHASKGSEYDSTFILESNAMGKIFPSVTKLTPLESLYLPPSSVSYSTERKILYTAMTRSKGNVYFISSGCNRGVFANELIHKQGLKEITLIEEDELSKIT